MSEIAGMLSLYLKKWALLGSTGLAFITTTAACIHLVNGDPVEIGGMAWSMTPMIWLVVYYHFRATQKEMGETASRSAQIT